MVLKEWMARYVQNYRLLGFIDAPCPNLGKSMEFDTIVMINLAAGILLKTAKYIREVWTDLGKMLHLQIQNSPWQEDMEIEQTATFLMNF